jgi:hypothetical protein
MADKSNIDNIPSDVSPYLYEIAERLQTRHTSVMVGSGLAKTRREAASQETFPHGTNWVTFFMRKYTKCPLTKKKKNILTH